MYMYGAVVKRVVDGDTVVLDIDLGRHIWIRDAPHRLFGCNAREHTDPGGAAARDHLAALLPAGAPVMVRTVKPDKYGDRYLAQVWLADGRDLVELLVADGWAARWNGQGARPLPPWPRPGA